MCRLFKGHVEISAGVCLVTAWFAAVNGWRLLGIVLNAVVVHELGHFLVLMGFGAKITGVRLSVFGAVLDANCAELSYGRELLSALAGPAANFLYAAVLTILGGEMAAGANLVLCAFNLLPVRPLDGGRAVYLAASWLAGPAAGETVSRCTGVLTAGTAAASILYLMMCSRGSLWLFPPAMGFFLAFVREAAGKGDFL